MVGRSHLMCVIQRWKPPMNMFDLSVGVAVITGGNGGIGLGIAQALASSGCNVSIWGRNAEKNKAAAATMAKGPGKVDSRVCNVADPASVKDAMKATLDAFGRVVATSSLASLFGTAGNEHYAATKAAINALCRALAVELARFGVTSNAILPGWIRSDMTARALADEKFVGAVMPRIPMRRFGEPSDFGGIAVYLMSKASSYHTADCFVIDGGYTAF